MAGKRFEQQVQERTEEFKLTPSEPVWMNIEAQLRKDKKRRWFFLLLFAGALLGIGALVYLQLSTSSQIQPTTVVQKPLAQPLYAQEPSIPVTISDTTATVNHSNLSSSNQLNSVASQQSVMQLKQSKTTVLRRKNNIVSGNIKKQETIAAVGKKEPVATDTVVHTPVTDVDSIIETQSKENKTADSTGVSPTMDTAKVVTERNDHPPTKILSDTTAVKKPAVTDRINKKWQTGWQFNTGIATIKEQLFATNKYRIDNSFSVALIGGTPSTAFPGVVVNEYKINSSLQWGGGFLLRRSWNKFASFVTGIQYQYSSVSVTKRQLVNVYSPQPVNVRTISQTEQTNNHPFHYVSIPTEIQWQLLKMKRRGLGITTGLQHLFTIAGSDSVLVSATGNKTATYLPLASIVPTYEWKSKRAAMLIGWYFHYGLNPVYKNSNTNNWWQTGLRFQYYFPSRN